MPETNPPGGAAGDDAQKEQEFAELAVKQGLVTRPQVEEALKAKRTIVELGLRRSLSDILLEKGLITEIQAQTVRRAVEAGGDAKIVAGFELLEKLGEGGMGMVYKARQLSLDRIVALKLLSERLSKDREFVGRFTREARMAARLDHVNIVRALDVGEAQGHHYFAMEFVEGEDIGSILDRDGRMAEDRAIEIVIQAARALDHAHGHQLIHRDIKPDNILLTKKGIAKVADLGLARSTDEHTTRLTVTGTAMGTPHYISPEQARGESDVDIRTDIYSLGVTFFHMLTGHPPFQGSTAAIVITRRLTEEPPWVRDVVPEVSEGTGLVVRKMIARERDDRYDSPADLIHDLELIADGKMPELAAGAPGTVVWSKESAAAPARGARAARPSAAAPAAPAAALKGGERGKVNPLVWAGIAAGGLVTVLLVVIVLVLATRSPGGGADAELEARAKAALAGVDGLAAEGKLAEAVAAAETAKSSFVGTAHETEFASRITELRARLDEQGREQERAAQLAKDAKNALKGIRSLRREGKLAAALERAREAGAKFGATSLAADVKAQFKREIDELEGLAAKDRISQEIGERVVKVKGLEEAGSLPEALALAKSSAEELEGEGDVSALVAAGKRIEAKIRAAGDEKHAAAAAAKLAEVRALVGQGRLDGKLDGKLDQALGAAKAAAKNYASTPSAKDLALLVPEIEKLIAERDRKRGVSERLKRALANAAFLMNARRYAPAATAYEDALKIDPDSAAARKGLGEARYRLHMGRSDEEERAGNLKGAAASVKKALEVRPKDPAAAKRLADLEKRLAESDRAARFSGVLAEARRLESAAKLDEALVTYRRALPLAPGPAERSKTSEAVARVERLVAARNAAGKVYGAAMAEVRRHVAAKRWSEAERAAGKALAAKPGDPTALAALEDARRGLKAALAVTQPKPAGGGASPVKAGPAVTNRLGMKLVPVPAGVYHIGDEEGQPDEQPEHEVTLRAFYIGVSEVTNAQYEKFDPRHKRERSKYSPGDDHPVVNVSWADAMKFCKWLSKRERATCRLPTEAEWEAAARGTDMRPYPWGGVDADHGGTYRANWGEGKDQSAWARDGHRYASPAGSFPQGKSPFGCLDMAGNVWEWCIDWYDEKAYAKRKGRDLTGPGRGSERVLRGGAFANDIDFARATNRHKSSPNRRDPTIGFRVVMERKPGK